MTVVFVHLAGHISETPHWPVREAWLHAVHAGLHGDLPLRFVLPVLLVTQQEETTQLLAPRRQQGCEGNTNDTNTYAHVLTSARRALAHTHACVYEHESALRIHVNNWLFSFLTSNKHIYPPHQASHHCTTDLCAIVSKACLKLSPKPPGGSLTQQNSHWLLDCADFTTFVSDHIYLQRKM